VRSGLVVLTALFGTNHLLAAVSNRDAWLHRLGAVANYLTLIAGVLVLWR